MKEKFQAKDIQEIIGIPKYRYEYLASKIGISPDIEEVEGTGYSHLYSFRNLLQFAFVHYANEMGLSPKACRKMIEVLDKFNDEMKKTMQSVLNLRKLGKKIGFPTYYPGFMDKTDSEKFGYYAQDLNLKYELNYIKKPDFSMFQLTMYGMGKKGAFYFMDPNNNVFVQIFDDEIPQIKKENIESAVSYITINLGMIKERILDKL